MATIRKKLKPDDQAANGGIKSNLKRLTKRLAFPFKEVEIKYWKDVLNTIQQSLQTALLALLIDQQRLGFDDVRSRFIRLSMDQSLHYSPSLQLLPLQLAGESQSSEAGSSAALHSLEHLHTATPSWQIRLDEAMSLLNPTPEDDLTRTRDFPPRTLRIRGRYASIPCTCRPQTSTLGYTSQLLAFTLIRKSVHGPQCPCYPLQSILTGLVFKVTLKKSVSLLLTRSEGTGIVAFLRSHRSSPAFYIVRNLVESSTKMPLETFRLGVRELFMVFQNKAASPHDRLPDGSTLLHAGTKR